MKCRVCEKELTATDGIRVRVYDGRNSRTFAVADFCSFTCLAPVAEEMAKVETEGEKIAE